MSRISSRGASLIAMLLVFVPVCLGAAWFAMRAPASAAGHVAEVRAALLRAGLGADALAAAGLSAQEANALVDAFSSAMALQPGALEQADSDYAAARVAKDQLQRKVRSGLASSEEVDALAKTKISLASAEATRQHVLDGWFKQATAKLAEAKVARLIQIQANADWKLPVAFMIRARDQAEWVAIRKALANERICAEYDQDPNPQMQSALATWRAEAPVAAAKSAYDANLAGVQVAWDAATGG
jgi:hypothetical protein